jgi:hypothetical protein
VCVNLRHMIYLLWDVFPCLLTCNCVRYRLGVQVIQVCVETRSSNGGMITLQEVLAFVRAKKKANSVAISAEDVKRAVEKISILNSGFKIIEVRTSALWRYHSTHE